MKMSSSNFWIPFGKNKIYNMNVNDLATHKPTEMIGRWKVTCLIPARREDPEADN